MKRICASALVSAQLCAGAGVARCAELTVFAPRAIGTVLAELGPKFEADTGNKLNMVIDLTPTLVKRFRAGEQADVVIALPELVDNLASDDLVIASSRADLVKSGLGLEVRYGSPKPDISSLEKFKKALLGAESIGYLKTPAGVHLDQQFERMGIFEQIAPKTKRPDTDIVSELVAHGEVQVGIVVATQILTTPGVDLAGLLPAEIQYYVKFRGAVAAKSQDISASKDLLQFLTSPAAKIVIEAQGMEPG